MPLSRGFSSHRLIALPTGSAQINKQKKKKRKLCNEEKHIYIKEAFLVRKKRVRRKKRKQKDKSHP
jgi:hypothetical protein